MPRGVKGSGKTKVTKSTDERIADADALIESLQSQLTNAKAKRKELLQSKEKEEYDAIQKVIKESGMTPEQLKEMIDKNK